MLTPVAATCWDHLLFLPVSLALGSCWELDRGGLADEERCWIVVVPCPWGTNHAQRRDLLRNLRACLEIEACYLLEHLNGVLADPEREALGFLSCHRGQTCWPGSQCSGARKGSRELFWAIC